MLGHSITLMFLFFNHFEVLFVVIIRSVFLNPGPLRPQHCNILYVSLSDLSISGPGVSSNEVKSGCLIRETCAVFWTPRTSVYTDLDERLSHLLRF